MGAWALSFQTETATVAPSPSPTVARVPPASGLEITGAVVAIVFALAAAWLGYRLIRGGRGI